MTHCVSMRTHSECNTELWNIGEAAVAVEIAQTVTIIRYYFALVHYYCDYFFDYTQYSTTKSRRRGGGGGVGPHQPAKMLPPPPVAERATRAAGERSSSCWWSKTLLNASFLGVPPGVRNVLAAMAASEGSDVYECIPAVKPWIWSHAQL